MKRPQALSSLLLFLACGGGGRDSESASSGVGPGTSDGTAGPTTSTTAEPTTTGGQTGGLTGSATDTSATATGATSTTGPGTSGTTGGGLPFCGEDPPKGFVGPFDMNCKSEPQVGTFTPVVEWNKKVWTTDPGFKEVLSQPVVAPLTDDDGDGVYGSKDDMPAVVAITYPATGYDTSSIIRAVSGDGSKELLSIKGQAISGASGLAVADIDDEPAMEIVAVTINGAVRAFEHDGTLKWTSAVYPGDFGMYPLIAAPAIGDMDGDGAPEVVVGRLILNGADGTLRGEGKFGVGRGIFGCASFPADVDGDGVQEVVVGNALYRPDGSAIWSIMQPDGYPAVADFDGDGGPEIVVASPGKTRLQTAAGGILWDVTNPGGAGGPPTIADYDGDGKPEIGIAGKTAYVVFDDDGAVLWQMPTTDASSATTGSAVYDFEGDGIADVVYADEHHLWVFAGDTGAVKLQFDHSSGTLIEYPIVVDVDNDGEVEIIFAQNDNYFGTSNGIMVLGDMDHSWRPGRKIWNQHAYNITNIGDDGSVPKVPAPNWLTHNNFRSGDLSANDGLAAPDLKLVSPDTCLNECLAPDMVKIWFQLGNAGAAPLTAGATVEVHGTMMGMDTLITSVDFLAPLAPGEFADAQSVVVASAGLEQIRLVAVPKEAECVVDPANEIVLDPPFCTAPG